MKVIEVDVRGKIGSIRIGRIVGQTYNLLVYKF